MIIWKQIKEFDDYLISTSGKVFSLKTNKIVKNILNQRTGYLAIGLHENGTTKTKVIHRLVAETFIPNLDNKPCVDHINGIKTDNRVENLRWVTHKENSNNSTTINYMKQKVWTNEERNNKIRLANKGKIISEEQKKKQSIVMKGKNKGLKRPEHSALMKLAKRDNLGRFIKKER